MFSGPYQRTIAFDGRIQSFENPDPRLRRAVHATDRAAPARDARLLRDPSVRRWRSRVHPRVRAQRDHPVGRPGTASPRATRPARRRPCGRWACPCSASATGCRRWPRSWAARSRPARCVSSATPRCARTDTPRSFAACRTARNAEGHGLLDVWMSHGDKVTALPPGFKLAGSSRGCAIAAMADESRRFYAVQFHPEVTHTKQGAAILARFAHDICGCGERLEHEGLRGRGRRADPCAGRRRRGDPRPLGRRRLVGRGGAHPPGDRRPAHVRLRRSRPACG